MYIGIDFGTSKSVVAAYVNGVPTVLPDEKGRRYTPSVVAVLPDKSLRIGWDAVEIPPFTRWESKFYTINSIKRSLGHQGKTQFGELSAYPQEIAALILNRLKVQAEARLGTAIKGVVLATPAYFNINEKWALNEAAQLAGLNVLRIIHEPTAAALAYGFHKTKDEKVAVFDLGGGTFDISLLEMGDGVYEVKATNGDTRLGGVDFTQAIVKYLCDEFKRNTEIDLTMHPEIMPRLTEAAEETKCALSSQAEVVINLPYLISTPSPHHLDCTLSRTQFEEMTKPLRERITECCKQVIKDAGMTIENIEKVILIGAATRTPSIITLARDLFHKEPFYSMHSTETVALGAASYMAVLEGKLENMLLLDVTPLSLGIETLGGIMTRLIERNTTIPTRKSEIFSTASDNQTAIEVKVIQGESSKANDNVLVGKLILPDLPPAPKGIPQIEVEFDISLGGVLHVTAKDLGTGKKVNAIFERPYDCLSQAQTKLLSERVISEMSPVGELVKQEIAHEQAQKFIQTLDRFMENATTHLSSSTNKLLIEGKRLILDYINRRASVEDLQALIERIKPQYSVSVIEWCLNGLDFIVSSEKFNQWVVDYGKGSIREKNNDALNVFRNSCPEEIKHARMSFEYALRTAIIPAEKLVDSVATSRQQRLLLEFMVSCLSFPEMNVPNWSTVESDFDDLLFAILCMIAGHGRSPQKRISAYNRLIVLSNEIHLQFLISIVQQEQDTVTAEAMAHAIGGKFGESLCKLFLHQNETERQVFKSCTILCRLMAHAGIKSLIGPDAADALSVLDEVGVKDVENYVTASVLQLSESKRIQKLIPIITRQSSAKVKINLIIVWNRLIQLSKEADLDFLISTVKQQQDAATAEEMAKEIVGKFEKELCRYYLRQNETERQAFKSCPILCRLMARAGIKSLVGPNVTDALCVLGEVGIDGFEDHLRDVVLQFHEGQEIIKLILIIAQCPSPLAANLLIEMVGKFSGEVTQAALNGLNGREDVVQKTFREALHKSEMRNVLAGCLIAVKHFKIPDYVQNIMKAWDKVWDTPLKLQLLKSVEEATGEPPIASLIACLEDPDPTVRKEILILLTNNKALMNSATLRLFKIASKAFDRKKRPHILDTLFLRSVVKSKSDLSPVAESLLKF